VPNRRRAGTCRTSGGGNRVRPGPSEFIKLTAAAAAVPLPCYGAVYQRTAQQKGLCFPETAAVYKTQRWSFRLGGCCAAVDSSPLISARRRRVNKTVVRTSGRAEQLFALCFSLAEVPHPAGGLAALGLPLRKQLCCVLAVPACRSSPWRSVPGTPSAALVPTEKHVAAL